MSSTRDVSCCISALGGQGYLSAEQQQHCRGRVVEDDSAEHCHSQAGQGHQHPVAADMGRLLQALWKGVLGILRPCSRLVASGGNHSQHGLS